MASGGWGKDWKRTLLCHCWLAQYEGVRSQVWKKMLKEPASSISGPRFKP